MQKIKTAEELESFLQENEEAILFKHSNTCPISAAAYEEFMNYVKKPGIKPWAIVVVQEARPVSHEIEIRLGVKHESPQILYVKGGKAIWNTSHWKITESALNNSIPQ